MIKIRKFLMGLNDEFRQIRSSILSMDTLPKLNKVYQMVTHEETQKELVASGKANMAMAFYTKSTTPKNNAPNTHAGKTPPSYQPSTSNARKKPPTPTEPLFFKSGIQVNTKYYCFHYLVFGHSDERCYKLHGYLTGHKLHKNNTSAATPIVVNASNKPQVSAHCVSHPTIGLLGRTKRKRKMKKKRRRRVKKKNH